MIDDHARFVAWLREVAPYVHAHRGKTFVVAFSGGLVEAGALTRLVHDLSLLSAMGIRLVLVHGSRPQVQAQLALKGVPARFHADVRITDTAALECAKEASGEIRLDIEAAFSQGLPSTPMAHSKVRVVSGNFVTARPLGVIDGVDYELTGVVRKVDADAIRFTLANGAIVLLSPLGFSPTGEAFNLTMEDLATSVATAIKADKLILLTETEGIRDAAGQLKSELSVQDAEAMLGADAVKGDPAFNLKFAVKACKAGVARAHIIPYTLDGSVLAELFTHEGVGTMVAPENLEKMRDATPDDVGGIIKLIEPLEADGTLVKRPRELIEREIDRFIVMEHDGFIFGCAALYPVRARAHGRAGLPDGAPGLPGLRRRRAADEAHRAAREGGRDQQALRADDAHRALLHQARLPSGHRRRPAAGAAAHVQLAAPLGGAAEADLGAPQWQEW